MNTRARLEAFDVWRDLNLETYRKTGRGVRTPVWFAAVPNEAGGPKLGVHSTADFGKAKRIRRNGVAKIAPCDARGRVTGSWIAAHATIVGREEFDRGMRLLNRKYRPWKQILDLFARHERVMFAIRLA